MATKAEVDRNRAALAEAAAKFASEGNVPECLTLVSCYPNRDSGVWHATYGSQIADSWDGRGPCYSHFVGDGDSKEAARAAALQDFVTRAGR